MPEKILLLFFAVLLLGFCSSCDTNFKKLFSKQTAREKYLAQLKKRSAAGSAAWAAMGEFALKHPVKINAPYAEAGLFSGKLTDAVAFHFTAKAGQLVTIQILPGAGHGLTLFADFWNAADVPVPALLESADTSSIKIVRSSVDETSYLLRMQPAMADTGGYTLSIKLSPMLAFPIPSEIKSNIGSFWGAGRDAGARFHEGIDIFAKKGSMAIAVADGYITRTGETNLGGKVVWLRPSGYNFSVYYAHLDSQLVQPGQAVKAGEPIGWVGNTGNAKFTPAHLHFGIYTRNGAVNPVAFVQKVDTPSIPGTKDLNQRFLATGKINLYPVPARNNPFHPAATDTITTEAFTGEYFRVFLPDSTRAFLLPSSLSDKIKL